MTTSDQLAAIEARLTADENEYSDSGLYDQSTRDRRALLAIIREQAEKLEAVSRIMDRAEMHGNSILYVDEVRAAITATEGV